MKHIFGYLKNYWYLVVVIAMLLIVQAYCDLSLPDYTSNIIDVGIANKGVEHCVPEYITKESYAGISIFLNEDEAKDWQSLYSLNEEKGYYALNDKSEESWDEADKEFETVIAVYYMMTANQDGDETTKGGQSKQDSAAMLKEMGIDLNSPTLMLDIRAAFEEKINELGDSIVTSMDKQFVCAELEKCGVNLDKKQTNYMWKAGAKMLAMALLVALCAIVIGFIASKVAAGVGRDLRGRIFTKVIGFSSAEMDKFSTASLITRTTNDVQQIQLVTVFVLRMVLYAPILAIGGIVSIKNYNSGMTWVIVLAVALIACIIMTLLIVAMPKFKKMQELVDHVNLVAREILTGLPVIRAFGREKREEEHFDEANTNLTNVMLFVNKAMAIMMPAMMFVMNGVSVLIIWVASKRIDAGKLQVGAMTAFITYSMIIIMSFLMLTAISIMLPRAGVAADRIYEILTTDSIILEKENAVRDVKNNDATVTFTDVCFKYQDGEENVLEDISFTAKPGQTTAIIGSTGCGKSTLVKLIPRFFDVDSGSITVGGVDVRDLGFDALRKQIGYVPQKGILFSGDINSNIAYGTEDSSKENIEEAASIAQAMEFITEKEDGFESAISQGGTNVSGGQKQRLSIARAIARNPKIYIFDDSFSALDFKTDTALRKALAKKTKDATVIIVAQRVSTILNADQIIVLDDGRIVGKGTHKELVKTCEAYDQIAQSQLSEQEYLKSIGEALDGKEEC